MSVYDDKRYQYIKKLCTKRKLNEAYEELKKYMIEYPLDNKVTYLYANILERMNKQKEAMNIFQKIVDESNDINLVCGSLYRISMRNFDNNMLDEAEEGFKKIIEISPHKEPQTYIGLAKVMTAKSEFRKAIKVLNEYEEENDKISIFKAEVYLRWKKIDDVYTEIDKIKDKTDLHIMRKINLINAKIECDFNKDYYKAKDYFKKAKVGVRDEQYYDILLAEAQLELKYRKYEECNMLCDEVINDFSKFALHAKILKGDSYLESKDYDKSYKVYMDALKYKRKREKINFRFGCLMFSQNKYDDAIKYLLKVPSEDHRYDKAMHLLTLCYIKKKNYIKAKRYVNYASDKNFLKFVINKNLGMDVKPINYKEMQFDSYSLSAVINHVMRTHTYENCVSFFKEDVCIEQVLLDALQKINEENLIVCGVLNKHIIPYSGVGYADSKEANAIEVVVEPETGHIFTMYPVYDVKFSEDNYKTESRIDKFNKKYGLTKNNYK